MTETEMKEMLKDIIDNGAEYEVKTPEDICLNALIGEEYLSDEFNNPIVAVELKWKPYKLGDEIHPNWEYRKVEKWNVYLESDGSYVTSNELRIRDTIFDKVVFEGSKEECEKWVEEHTNKTWLDEYLYSNYGENAQYYIRIGAKEICKKILEEVRKNEGIEQMTKFYIAEIIKDLGVEV